MAEAGIPIDNEQQYHQLLPLFTEQSITAYNNPSPATHDDQCYYCAITKQIHNQDYGTLDECDQKNLIIHKGKHALVLFSHYPFCPGNIVIIPYAHYTSRNNMPHEVATEMRTLLTQLYPHLLSLFNADDISMGMISYDAHAAEKHHICYEIMPRPGITAVSPITHTQYIHTNVMSNYHQLVALFKRQ
jgi:diadenosine tetraphosphate (Ap4A) HIT family hydrolase